MTFFDKTNKFPLFWPLFLSSFRQRKEATTAFQRTLSGLRLPSMGKTISRKDGKRREMGEMSMFCFVRPTFERILKKLKMGDGRWDPIAVPTAGMKTGFQDAWRWAPHAIGRVGNLSSNWLGLAETGRPSSGGRTRRTSVSFAAKSTRASSKVMISVERMVMTREVPSIQWIPLLTTQQKAVLSASCASRSEGCSFKQSSSPHRPVMPHYLEIRLGEPGTSSTASVCRENGGSRAEGTFVTQMLKGWPKKRE